MLFAYGHDIIYWHLLAPGPHPRRELTLMRRRRLRMAAGAAWPQALGLIYWRRAPHLSRRRGPTPAGCCQRLRASQQLKAVARTNADASTGSVHEISVFSV